MQVQELINICILIASFLTALTTICVAVRKIINKALKPLCTRIDKVDIHQCKSYLVDFLSDVEKRNRKR